MMKGFILLLSWLICWGGVLSSHEVLSQAVIVNPHESVSVSEKEDWTDKERHKSQTFVNEALGNKIIREECAKLKDPKACQGRGEGFKVLGLDSNMISYVAKAYSLLMGGMYKGGLDAKTSKGGGGEGEIGKVTGREKGGKKNDYCALIGAGAETVGMAMQQLSAKTIQAPSRGGTDQKKILYKAARSHRDRAKSATLQSAGWGGASACYVSMMTFGGAAVNSVNNILKTAAASLLSAFYFKERGLQKKYADQVKKIADKLPGPGDCNPITQKDCYCSLEEYQNDPEHCVPYLHRKKLSQGSILRVACTNDKLQADPDCRCLGTDSCLDKRLKNAFVGSGMGSGFVTAPIGKEVASLTRGEIKSGALASFQRGKNAALNTFFKNLKKNDLPPSVTLSSSGERDASRLNRDFGLPLELARHLVAAPKPPEQSSNVVGWGGGPGKGHGMDSAVKKDNSIGQVWAFRGGRGLHGKKKSPAPSPPGFDFQKYLARGKKKKSLKRGNILEFNRRAVNSAEVGKNGEKNIFHIISRRYMLWKIRH